MPIFLIFKFNNISFTLSALSILSRSGIIHDIIIVFDYKSNEYYIEHIANSSFYLYYLPGNYEQKYLKYKKKYLELKKINF
jgi:hypothetical protein